MDIFYKEIINHGRLRDLGNSGMMWCGYAMELGRMLRSKLERVGGRGSGGSPAEVGALSQ